MANNFEEEKRLIARVKKGDRKALEEIYRENYLPIRRFIFKNSGSPQDAEDIYQEAFILLYEDIKAGKLDDITSKTGTYLFSIAKNKWLHQLRKQSKNPHYPVNPQGIYTGEIKELEGESLDYVSEILQKVLDKLDDPCKEILGDFYYARHSMEEIAQTYGYGNANVAKSKKNKCMNKARSILKNLLQYQSK